MCSINFHSLSLVCVSIEFYLNVSSSGYFPRWNFPFDSFCVLSSAYWRLKTWQKGYWLMRASFQKSGNREIMSQDFWNKYPEYGFPLSFWVIHAFSFGWCSGAPSGIHLNSRITELPTSLFGDQGNDLGHHFWGNSSPLAVSAVSLHQIPTKEYDCAHILNYWFCFFFKKNNSVCCIWKIFHNSWSS